MLKIGLILGASLLSVSTSNVAFWAEAPQSQVSLALQNPGITRSSVAGTAIGSAYQAFYGLEEEYQPISVNNDRWQDNAHHLVADEPDSIRSLAEIEFCQKVNRKLSSISHPQCLSSKLSEDASRSRSVQNQPIYFTDFGVDKYEAPRARILLLGGVHGNELSSVSVVIKWLEALKLDKAREFQWRVVPLLNPDGFFKRESSRTNANGVDLNRNLPTQQWLRLAHKYWKEGAKSRKSKFPGSSAGSEPETQWLVEVIRSFKPDLIVSVHAPFNLVDFDAWDRSYAPRKLGILKGKQLGTYPGSLGNYSGEELNVPVITIELPHAGKVPDNSQLESIWSDLDEWMRTNITSHNG